MISKWMGEHHFNKGVHDQPIVEIICNVNECREVLNFPSDVYSKAKCV